MSKTYLLLLFHVSRVVRRPTDIGIKRKQPTASENVIKANLLTLKRTAAELFNGKTLSNIIKTINNQLRHATCLADIPVLGSTNACESLHRLFKFNLRSISKFGPRLGLARLYGFSYIEAKRRGPQSKPNKVNMLLMENVCKMMQLHDRIDETPFEEDPLFISAVITRKIFQTMKQVNAQINFEKSMYSSDADIIKAIMFSKEESTNIQNTLTTLNHCVTTTKLSIAISGILGQAGF